MNNVDSLDFKSLRLQVDSVSLPPASYRSGREPQKNGKKEIVSSEEPQLPITSVFTAPASSNLKNSSGSLPVMSQNGSCNLSSSKSGRGTEFLLGSSNGFSNSEAARQGVNLLSSVNRNVAGGLAALRSPRALGSASSSCRSKDKESRSESKRQEGQAAGMRGANNDSVINIESELNEQTILSHGNIKRLSNLRVHTPKLMWRSTCGVSNLSDTMSSQHLDNSCHSVSCIPQRMTVNCASYGSLNTFLVEVIKKEFSPDTFFLNGTQILPETPTASEMHDYPFSSLASERLGSARRLERESVSAGATREVSEYWHLISDKTETNRTRSSVVVSSYSQECSAANSRSASTLHRDVSAVLDEMSRPCSAAQDDITNFSDSLTIIHTSFQDSSINSCSLTQTSCSPPIIVRETKVEIPKLSATSSWESCREFEGGRNTKGSGLLASLKRMFFS